MTRDDRADKIVGAALALPAALALAQQREAAAAALADTDPATHPAVLAAWAEVERLGAIIHRQARLLAGKSKGG